MDSLLEYLKKSENSMIISLYTNLKSKGLQIKKIFSKADSVFKNNATYIYNIINIYIKLYSLKKKPILRNIVYLNKKFLKSKRSTNISKNKRIL